MSHNTLFGNLSPRTVPQRFICLILLVVVAVGFVSVVYAQIPEQNPGLNHLGLEEPLPQADQTLSAHPASPSASDRHDSAFQLGSAALSSTLSARLDPSAQPPTAKVPEPSSLILLALGLVSVFVGYFRRSLVRVG